jgi:hypothetical protein
MEEIELLRRQTLASYANVVSVFIVSVVLLLLTYWQWRTAESTARIERAKAQPHFRVQQQNERDELGILTRKFTLQADSGVADATNVEATSIMVISYASYDLRLWGSCRASFVDFYETSIDPFSFEVGKPADRFMLLSRQPDRVSPSFIRLRPSGVSVRVSFTDIFGDEASQEIVLANGHSRTLKADNRKIRDNADLALSLQLRGDGSVAASRIGTGSISQDCANALKVMARIPWLRMGALRR